jgi:hypothetical protein
MTIFLFIGLSAEPKIHLITLSALASTLGGIAKPSGFRATLIALLMSSPREKAHVKANAE